MIFFSVFGGLSSNEESIIIIDNQYLSVKKKESGFWNNIIIHVKENKTKQKHVDNNIWSNQNGKYMEEFSNFSK